MDPYDIGQAFAEIEAELIASMIRNMKRHRAEETKEGFEWTQWQAQQLKALEAYKKANKKKYGKKFRSINNMLAEAIKEARAQGNMDQEIEILEALKKGFARYSKADADILGEFFKLNDRKLEALIKATTDDFQKGEQAILRMAEDQYRQIIFNAQVYANTGAGTYEKAVDMATKGFLERGINCITYANGARHLMSDYADMAIRTAAKRAYLAGEGEKRMEWGISLVIVNKRGNPCPKCLPFCGKILIDDVYSGGSKEDGNYPLLSRAMELGLYHPRCQDTHTTYFEGISSPPDDHYTEDDIEEIKENYTTQQKRNVAKRNYDKYSRMAENSLDIENQQKYAAKAEYWKDEYAKYYKPLSNRKKDIEQYRRYKNNLQELAPKSIEKFLEIKYNDSDRWKDLKRKYRIVNQYKIDHGTISPSEILKMDRDIMTDKINNFSSDYKRSGNIAGVILDNEDRYIIAHSKANEITDKCFKNYRGNNQIVLLKESRHYKDIPVIKENGEIREDAFYDTEAKLFEHLRVLYQEKQFKKVKMLSERGMCDSCLGIMDQFVKEHPDVEVVAVSNKKVEGNVSKHRYRKK